MFCLSLVAKFWWHGFHLSAKEHIQEQGFYNVIPVMTQAQFYWRLIL